MALITEKPTETYHKMKESERALANATPVDELPQEQRDWLRAT